MQGTSAPAAFRALLDGPMAVLPGCFDCITARAIQRGGFKGAYMSGGGTSFSLGYPDYGLITMNEMVDNAGRIADALEIPVIADADTGYGNELNVTRTIRAFEKSGIAGVHLEDQEFPKKCGHLADKRVISRDAYVSKIAAAAAARRDPNFVIIARTDARAANGFDEAVDRANAALDAGADVAFIEAMQDLDELREAPKRVRGPLLLNIVWNGRSPNVSAEMASDMGYAVAIAPGLLLRSIMLTCTAVLAEYQETGRFPELGSDWTVADTFAFNGAAAWDAISSTA